MRFLSTKYYINITKIRINELLNYIIQTMILLIEILPNNNLCLVDYWFYQNCIKCLKITIVMKRIGRVFKSNILYTARY